MALPDTRPDAAARGEHKVAPDLLPQRLAEIGIRAPVLVSVYVVVGAAVTTSLVGLVLGRLRYAVLRVAFGTTSTGFLIYGTVSQPVLLATDPVPVATVLVDQAVGAAQYSRVAGRCRDLHRTHSGSAR